MGSQALLQNFEAAAAAAARAKQLSSNQTGSVGPGPPVLTSCLSSGVQTSGSSGGFAAPPSPTSSCGSSVADASSRSLPPRLSPAPGGPGHVSDGTDGMRLHGMGPGNVPSSTAGGVNLESFNKSGGFSGAHLLGSHSQVGVDSVLFLEPSTSTRTYTYPRFGKSTSYAVETPRVVSLERDRKSVV